MQRAYAEEYQQYLETGEKNIVLAELLFIQEKATAVYEKHQRWLAAGRPTEVGAHTRTVAGVTAAVAPLTPDHILLSTSQPFRRGA